MMTAGSKREIGRRNFAFPGKMNRRRQVMDSRRVDSFNVLASIELVSH